MISEYALRLQGIRFKAHVGASREERATLQEVIVDVDLLLPVSSMPRRDHRRDVVDYDRIVTRVVETGSAEQYRLLEVVARCIVERLLEETPALRVRAVVKKLRAPTRHPVDCAAVELVAVR
jgi:dihydroneopterin aldolase